MTALRTTTAALLVLAGTCFAQAADPPAPPALGRPEGEAVFVEQAPVVDGRLDDAVWASTPRLLPYYRLGSRERPAAATWTKVVWTATTLYVATSCQEPFPYRIRAELHEYDAPVYNDDSVEIFLDPEGVGIGYAQLDVNSLGTRYDNRQYGTHYQSTWYNTAGAIQVDWRPQWSAQARVENDRWTVEVAVPFEALGGTPRPGDTWGANFARERYAESELSTWTPLPGVTFLQPHNFGRLIFRGPPPPQPRLVERRRRDAPAPLPLVPMPREVSTHRGRFDLGPVVRLLPSDAGAARYLKGCAALLPDAEIVPPGSTADGPTVHLATLGASAPLADVRSLAGRLRPVSRPQGYQLLVTDRAVGIVGTDADGVRNGLMTLFLLLRRTESGYALPRVDIRDWPAESMRAWHAGLPGADDGDVYRQWVDGLARLKYNTLVLEVNGNFPYESHPEVGRAGAPTKDQVRGWVDYARQRGFEVIPQVAVYGHFNWVLNRPGWADLAENPDAGGNRGRWVANVLDPRYYRLVFDLFQEVIDVFEPTLFHIGHDEITFQPIGVHPMTRGTPPARLLADEVTGLHDWLAARGLRTMMWGDQFLPEHNGGAPYFTAGAIDDVPTDILIADWHYGADAQFPSVAYFKEKGFPVVAAGWWQPLNIWNLSRVAANERVLGFSGTTWWRVSGLPLSAEHQVAFVLGAENTWSPGRPAIDALGYQPGSVWRHLAGWARPAAETEYAPLDLDRHANRSLADTQIHGGWLSLGPEHDLSSLPRGLRWWDGVPYRIASRAPQAIVLAAADDPPSRAPHAVRDIAVGTRARALYFLQTCSAPASRTADIYTRASQYPTHLGRWVVTYDDGTSAEISLDYRQSLTDWNDGTPPAQASVVWHGHDAGGAYVALSAYRWDNPRPGEVIRRLDLYTDEAPLRIAVLAVTAVVR